MNILAIPAARQLLLLAAALTFLALLIGWSAFLSWREIRELRSGFTTAQLESFRIADQLQAGLLRLHSHLLKYEDGRRPEDRRSFEDESRGLNAWIDEQKTALTTPEEKAILSEINAAYDGYLAATSEIAAGAASFDKLQVEAAEERLISLGLKLANAHREALGRLVASTQQSLALLQAVIFTALLALVLLAAWAAAVVYRKMIAPLRVKLIESQALVERHEKLASLGVLAAGVAHEIRNPLTAIKARLFTQQKALAPGSRERADAEFIGREIDRLEKIVSDFLRFARPVEPERMPLIPSSLLHEVRQLMAPQLRESSIDLVVERAVETKVLADPEQLKQVLINLVQNAAEALGKGGTIKLRAVESRITLGGRMREVVIIEVEDNGTGIPPEVQKRLFDPFFTTKQSGTGLGLSIVARIVEKHAGALRFQTAVNRGTTFGVVLPVKV
jgi:signal transduction histidine kinase